MTINPLLPEKYDPATILDWWAEKRKDIQRLLFLYARERSFFPEICQKFSL